jgi:hypothetical protein
MKVKQLLHDKELIQKLWQTFRIGQTTYVAYGIGLVNFTLILYRLGGIDQYIEPLPFTILLVAIMAPLGVGVGVLHIRKQVPVEAKIMAHHNPYIYKVIQNSKETMAIKTSLWQFDIAETQNDFLILQSKMNKKLWVAINELTGKEVFTQENMEQMDKIENNLRLIERGITDRKNKYQQLYEGKDVKDISGAEDIIELEKDNTNKD